MNGRRRDNGILVGHRVGGVMVIGDGLGRQVMGDV